MTPPPSRSDAWLLTYDTWDPAHQPLREALCTLGNGYVATRGAAEEASAGGAHYPGTYLAGGYNRLRSTVADRMIENEDLVNWPNWLCLSFRTHGGPWFHVDAVTIVEFQQQLDLRRGALARRVRFRDADGRETTLISRRIVHMGNPHLAAVAWELTPLNWSGEIEVRAALDGTVTNSGVERYRTLSSRHLRVLEACESDGDEESIVLAVETTQSRLRMTQAARTRVLLGNGTPLAADRRTIIEGGLVEQRLRFDARTGTSARIEKTVAIFSSRDLAISEPTVAARNAIARAPSFEELLEDHARAWSRLWHRADVEITDRDAHAQRILRLHIFHLLQTTSLNSVDLDVGVPARGLHGEAYRGHIFWDELFIIPFFNLRLPELSRSLLKYRHRRLPEARHRAAAAGFRGAMFPWQSASSGREENQVMHLNPRSGRWVADNTHLQRHVNAAIAYNVWHYVQATGDRECLSTCGAEMLLEIARFWASITTFNPARERYEIRGVVGPDEFHTEYPERDGPGVDNNAYTNVMASWVLRCARRALDLLPEGRAAEVLADLRIDGEELARWDDIGRRMFVPFHGNGIVSQFEGYERLAEFDWEGYRAKYGDIQRLDRILEAEGDTPNRYKVSKQADVLMLLYLFSAEELYETFGHLGYGFTPEMIGRNIEYYMQRTSDGSTLSRVVHSWVLARSDRERAWTLFRQALDSDISDIQGGTTAEGVHLGAMAGTVDIVQRCHTGFEVRDDVLWLNPTLPTELREIHFRLRYRGHWLRLRVSAREVGITLERGGTGSVVIGIRGRIYRFAEGDARVFAL